jgi:hypothetical protein
VELFGFAVTPNGTGRYELTPNRTMPTYLLAGG